jgi:hypothetical protein
MEVGNLIKLIKDEWYNPHNPVGNRGWVMTDDRRLFPDGPVFFHDEAGIILDIKSILPNSPHLDHTVTDMERWFMVSYPAGIAWFHEDNVEPA